MSRQFFHSHAICVYYYYYCCECNVTNGSSNLWRNCWHTKSHNSLEFAIVQMCILPGSWTKKRRIFCIQFGDDLINNRFIIVSSVAQKCNKKKHVSKNKNNKKVDHFKLLFDTNSKQWFLAIRSMNTLKLNFENISAIFPIGIQSYRFSHSVCSFFFIIL